MLRKSAQPHLLILLFFFLSAPLAARCALGAETLYPKGKIFPLLMLGVEPKDFKEVKAAGFNAVHVYDSGQKLANAKEYLKRAGQEGLFVVQNLPAARIPEAPAWWANWIKELAPFDNLAWWYLPEEKPAPKIRHVAEAVRGNDRKKRPAGAYLAWQSERTLGSFGGVFDYVVRSAYPNFNREPHVSVVAWVTNIRNVRQSIPLNIACGEFFSLDGKEKPDARGLRFDQYAALVAGAKGMAWYSWARGGRALPEALSAARTFAWEMSGKGNPTPLGAVILSEDIPQTIRSHVVAGPEKSPETFYFDAKSDRRIKRTWPSILTLQKKWEGSTYFIAVNSAEVFPRKGGEAAARVEAEFSNLPKSGAVEVLFENRKIPIENGRFKDRFEELGVHVYRFSKEKS